MGQFLSNFLPLAIFIGMIAAVAIWHEWAFRLRPLFIPKAEINALVNELIAKHGPDAEEKAYIKEDRAWRYSNTFEQGKWRRVRRELHHRYRAGESNL
ncbi:MAG: hypothetical protein C0606_04665 [Hyphomicrobiales bacterium]|nr:MAG: hypothetical protein C0606_04665 [Hyphomicrobiales bacterium]